jgi:4-hydroxyphenylpyruvate dioxygenase
VEPALPLLPGQGGFDLTGFMEDVLAAGYTGPLSLEVFNDVFRQADAERTATDALRSLIALEESLAHRPLVPVRRGSGSSWPPAGPVQPSGLAFVEITVDPLAELAAEQLLRRAGFAHVASHRSKPVRMWQQGGARVLLNRTRPVGDDRPRGAGVISAIAMETKDPARSAERARQLLAPAVPRAYGPGEADLFATAAPDQTQVFFCRTGEAGGWLDDFGARPRPEPDGAETLTRIDHVGLSQPRTTSTRPRCSTGRCWDFARTRPRTSPTPTGLSEPEP